MRLKSVAFTALLFVSSSQIFFAAGPIETTGDVLAIVLPATAGGLTLAYPGSEGSGKVEDFLGGLEERVGLGYRDTAGTVQFLESMGATLATTSVLKYTVHEERPNGESQSFPSGHSANSFFAAEFMRKRYGWEYGIPAYALASFVAYSRVEAGRHWPHDVIAGAGIGIVSSYIFTRPYHGWNVQAQAGRGYYGVSLSRAW